MKLSELKGKIKDLGIDPELLIAAIQKGDDEDVEMELPTGKFLTDDEIALRDKNKYNEGKTVAEEMAVKEIKKTKGLDFQGKKINDLVEYLSTKGDTEEVAAIRKANQDLNAQISTLQTTIASQSIDFEVSSAIPNVQGFTQKEIKAMMAANGYEFSSKDGKVVVSKDGEIVRDLKTADPLDVKSVTSTFLTSKKLIGNEPAPQGGAGGSTKPPASTGKSTSMSAISKQYADTHGSGKLLTLEFAKHVEDTMKEVKEAGGTFSMD